MNEESFILVGGCDGDVESDPALRFAVEEAVLRTCPLLILAAYERPIDPDVDNFDVTDAELIAAATTRTEAAFQRALGSRTCDLPAHRIATEEGDPGRALLARSRNAELIVIGSHDRSMLQRLFARPTTRELLHDSTVPIVVVPSVLR